MEETSVTASEISIRHSPFICDGEKKYISSRKKIILNTLKELHIDCDEVSLPHIALLGSGGGERATVGMLGSTDQLVKEGLFDTLLYTGGVSGSTWAMASLYSDPHFESHVNKIISKMSGPGMSLEQIVTWLEDRTDIETFSLTDIWAVLTSAKIMKQLELRHLSEEAGRNGTNPYPVYSAVERELTSEDPTSGHWFEVSPHESGYTELDLFVDTSHLGSKFVDGRLQKKMPEMDMVKLQGICGSALADLKMIILYLLNFLEHLHEQMTTPSLRRVYQVLNSIMGQIRGFIREPDVLASLDKFQQRLKEMGKHHNSEHFSPESADQLLQELEDHCQNLQAANDSNSSKLDHMLKLLILLLKGLMRWEWGNTRHFLYHYQGVHIPHRLFAKEIIYLIDAGLWMNVPYPPFLGDKRAIDLIIAPDFSAGNIFETLTLAKKYALDRAKPFPKIDDKYLGERNWPKDCYVFEGEKKEPTIVYMPLFNRENCKDEKEVKKMMEEFGTFQLPYSIDKLEKLLNIARDNIKRNKSVLLREIKKAASRKRQLSSE